MDHCALHSQPPCRFAFGAAVFFANPLVLVLARFALPLRPYWAFAHGRYTLIRSAPPPYAMSRRVLGGPLRFVFAATVQIRIQSRCVLRQPSGSRAAAFCLAVASLLGLRAWEIHANPICSIALRREPLCP